MKYISIRESPGTAIAKLSGFAPDKVDDLVTILEVSSKHEVGRMRVARGPIHLYHRGWSYLFRKRQRVWRKASYGNHESLESPRLRRDIHQTTYYQLPQCSRMTKPDLFSGDSGPRTIKILQSTPNAC